MRGHADRNASLVIGQRLVARCQTIQQEKPPTPLLSERAPKDAGVGVSQEPKTEAVGHLSLSERHGNANAHGTAQERRDTDGCPLSDMLPPLRSPLSRSHAASAPKSDYGSVSEAAGLDYCPVRECHIVSELAKMLLHKDIVTGC
jgi:hypothetical protein